MWFTIVSHLFTKSYFLFRKKAQSSKQHSTEYENDWLKLTVCCYEQLVVDMASDRLWTWKDCAARMLKAGIHLWATVCKTVRPMLSDRWLSVWPVCDVGVLWLNGWMDSDAVWYMEVNLGPGHILLDGDTAPPKRGTHSHFCPYLLWPNGWMDQGGAWYGGRIRPGPRRHWVRLGPISTRPKTWKQ